MLNVRRENFKITFMINLSVNGDKLSASSYLDPGSFSLYWPRTFAVQFLCIWHEPQSFHNLNHSFIFLIITTPRDLFRNIIFKRWGKAQIDQYWYIYIYPFSNIIQNLGPHYSCCSLHKNSTIWSLTVWAGRCLWFHLQFPPGLWMNQPPSSRGQPTSSS